MVSPQSVPPLWQGVMVYPPYSSTLLYRSVDSHLWDIVFAFMGIHCVFPKIVKEALINWRGFFCWEKGRKIWKSILLFIFWIVWKEQNRRVFKDESLAVQKLKHFVYYLWSWNKVCLDEETNSLLRVLEWLD